MTGDGTYPPAPPHCIYCGKETRRYHSCRKHRRLQDLDELLWIENRFIHKMAVYFNRDFYSDLSPTKRKAA